MNGPLQKWERGVTQYDREYFIKQFEGLPPKAQAILALRAAMRVLPVLADRAGGYANPFGYWKADERGRNALDIIRCYQAPAFVNSLTKADSDARTAAHAAADTAFFAADAVGCADGAATAASQASASARAACYAVSARVSAHVVDADPARAAAYACAAEFRIVAGDGGEPFLRRAAKRLVAARVAAAVLADIQQIKSSKETPHNRLLALLSSPLWQNAVPPKFEALLQKLSSDLRSLDAGFEVWIDWYQDRLDGRLFNWDIERQWALLSKEQLSQSPAEINAYLKALRDGTLTQQLKRVRAIFIGHGEVGKTSLINVLHGKKAEPRDRTTKGVSIKDATIEKDAGVFTRVMDYKKDDLTVHFWDFGGQVMAHATHQFFLRSKCLYVIVLAGRSEINSNEEAEYWLEHVRAFGDGAPVLLVGNKADVFPVNLDLRRLKDKYPNIVDFYSLSCAKAKGAFKRQFEIFRERFGANLKALGEQAERFSPAQFEVLKTIEENAAKDDFLKEAGFDEICRANGIAMEGPGGRDGLLDIFDKLGIVMHFKMLPFLTEYVLNPRWLTYGVYTIMYSDEAKEKRGRLSGADLVAILKKANPSIANGHPPCYPPDRCRIIADAMIAFQVAYPLGDGAMVIPALLASDQPDHDFEDVDALAFRFDFGGFLPRHVLPALIVEYFRDIAKVKGAEIVWQNGVLLRPKRLEAEAFVRADYHTRTIDFLIKGGDGPLYLCMLRDSVLSTLETMPKLPYEEKVELRPDMRADAAAPSGDASVWMSYGSILGAQRRKRVTIDGPDGKEYALDRVLAAAPVRPELQSADVFLSYSSKDGAKIKKLDGELTKKRFSVWFDRGLIAGQPYRDVLQKRIETVKAVVVLWTENSVGSKWVRAEADLADKHGKLICLRDPRLRPEQIPMPYAANDHIIPVGDMPGLIAALDLKGAKPRI